MRFEADTFQSRIEHIISQAFLNRRTRYARRSPLDGPCDLFAWPRYGGVPHFAAAFAAAGQVGRCATTGRVMMTPQKCAGRRKTSLDWMGNDSDKDRAGPH